MIGARIMMSLHRYPENVIIGKIGGLIMHHEQFIEFETAKLAKQAGFDWEVNNYYNIRGDLNSLYGYRQTNAYRATYSAPTQAVLQRWLREEKNREVVVDIDLRIAHYYEPMIGNYTAEDECRPAIIWQRIGERKYTNYEAALEAGLQKCLTLLIKKQ